MKTVSVAICPPTSLRAARRAGIRISRCQWRTRDHHPRLRRRAGVRARSSARSSASPSPTASRSEGRPLPGSVPARRVRRPPTRHHSPPPTPQQRHPAHRDQRRTTRPTDGLHAIWKISETSLGDEVLELVRDGAVTDLSIGFIPVTDRWSTDRSQVERVRAPLDHVAVVRTPAYPDARDRRPTRSTGPHRATATPRPAPRVLIMATDDPTVSRCVCVCRSPGDQSARRSPPTWPRWHSSGPVDALLSRHRGHPGVRAGPWRRAGHRRCGARAAQPCSPWPRQEVSQTMAPPISPTCPPRFSTARNRSRPTYGPRVGQVANLLGRPLMPWQQAVADTALEVDPATGSRLSGGGPHRSPPGGQDRDGPGGQDPPLPRIRRTAERALHRPGPHSRAGEVGRRPGPAAPGVAAEQPLHGPPAARPGGDPLGERFPLGHHRAERDRRALPDP